MAEIFPSLYLHGGCDEVNWGGSALSRQALQPNPAPKSGRVLNALNSRHRNGKAVHRVGRLGSHKDPQILALLSKDIIIMDWNYTDTSSTKVHDGLASIRANGSRAIGAPALINYQWGPRAGARQLRNVDAFADAYFASPDPGSLGVILTNWFQAATCRTPSGMASPMRQSPSITARMQPGQPHSAASSRCIIEQNGTKIGAKHSGSCMTPLLP